MQIVHQRYRRLRQTDPAPTMKNVELDLLAKQLGQERRVHGSISWIAEGLRIEEAQITLRLQLRQLGPHPTEAQQLPIARKRDQIQSHISKFHAEANAFIGNASDVDDAGEEYPEYTVWSDGDINDEGDEDGTSGLNGGSSIAEGYAEDLSLPLPSVLGAQRRHSKSLEELAAQELQLRIGQANDALHELRVALIDKAMLFRTEVRHSKSQATTTRAWAKVSTVQKIVSRYAAIYRRARQQMVTLGAEPNQLSRYKPLTPGDLKASSAIADPNSRGQRNSNLAWFWSMDIPGDTRVDHWMSECGSIVFMFCYLF